MKKIIFFLIFVAVVSGFTGFGIGTSKPDAPSKASSVVERSMIEHINKERQKRSLTALREDPGLNETAKLKAEDMAARNYWQHTPPDGTPFQVLMIEKRPGLKFYGENLAECFKTNKETLDAWVASPGHLDNIVKPDYTIFGSYTVYDQDKGCMITVNHFGKE